MKNVQSKTLKYKTKRICDCTYSEIKQYCCDIYGMYAAYATFAVYETLFRSTDESEQEVRWHLALTDKTMLPAYLKKSSLTTKIRISY